MHQYKKIGFFGRIAHVWAKEYKMIFTDFAAIFTFFIITVVVSLLYTYIYSQQVVQDLPIAVVDEDFSTESRLFTRMLDETPEVEADYLTASFTEAQQWFKDHKVRGVVCIPKGFAKHLYTGRTANVSVYCDASYMLYYRQVYSATAFVTAYMNKGIEIKSLNAQGRTTEQARLESMPVSAKAVPMYNTNFGYASFLMPAVYIIVIQYVLLSGIGLLGGTRRELERESDKVLQIRHLRDAFEVLVGRVGAYTSLMLLIFAFVFAVVFPMFNLAQRANVLEVLFWMLPFVLAVSLLAIALTAFFRFREDAVMVIMLTAIPTILISGITWPLEQMPIPLQAISYLLPSSLTIKGFVALTQADASFVSLSHWWGKLWLLAGFYFVLAMLRMYKLKGERA